MSDVPLIEAVGLDEKYPRLEACYDEIQEELTQILNKAETDFELKIALNKDKIPEEKYDQVMARLNQCLLIEQSNINYKIFMIKKVGETKIRQFRSITKIMYRRLNDWVISTIKADNAFIFDIVEKFKDLINNRKLINV